MLTKIEKIIKPKMNSLIAQNFIISANKTIWNSKGNENIKIYSKFVFLNTANLRHIINPIKKIVAAVRIG